MSMQEKRPGIPSEPVRVERRNWIQRRLIQQELVRRGYQQSQPAEKELVEDPLAPVKLYYYQMYCEAVGQPNVPAESSPSHAAAAAQISIIVEHTAIQSQATYERLREQSDNLPDNLHDDTEQYLNRIIAAISHSSEDILEITVKSMAQEDPLFNSKVGRLIRRVLPSVEQRAIKRVSSSAKRELDNISKQFLQEVDRKYRR